MEYFIYIGTLIAIYATLTISLNLLVGYTGLISIAQAGIYGVGAYTTALLALNVTNDLLVSFVLPRVAGVLVSLIVALPSLRLKNEYFLIATMGFQAIIFSMFMNLEITGGASGLYGVPHPTLFGYTIRSQLREIPDRARARRRSATVLALRITQRAVRPPVARRARGPDRGRGAGQERVPHQAFGLRLLGGLRGRRRARSTSTR